jgi:hypothetical protein
MVRYLYSLVDRYTIMQNMQILKERKISTSVSKVECYVCGKGLQDGHSITAKTLPNGIVLFCDVHYSLQ